jgi:hypothetical protein
MMLPRFHDFSIKPLLAEYFSYAALGPCDLVILPELIHMPNLLVTAKVRNELREKDSKCISSATKCERHHVYLQV